MITGGLQRLREWSSLLPLLLLLGATYWLNQQVHPLPPEDDGSKRHDPDLIITKPVAITLDKQGLPHFILSAQKIVHYPDNDSTYLDEPHLTTLFPNRPPVHTTARQGEISSNGNEVFMRYGVKIVRDANALQTEMTLTSSSLHVVPDHDLMDTDGPVTLIDANNVMHAVGMTYNNKSRVIDLLAQVRSQHEIIRP